MGSLGHEQGDAPKPLGVLDDLGGGKARRKSHQREHVGHLTVDVKNGRGDRVDVVAARRIEVSKLILVVAVGAIGRRLSPWYADRGDDDHSQVDFVA